MPEPDEMMDELNRWLIRMGKVFIGCALLILVLFVVAWWISPPPPRAAPEFTDEIRVRVTERMRHHGIERAELDQATGERYFWRDGQRCKL